MNWPHIWLLQLLLLLVGSQLGQSARILFFFSGGTYSHKVSIYPFVVALADRGHNVTYVSSFKRRPMEHPQVRDLAPRGMVEAMEKLFGTVDRLTLRLQGAEVQLFNNYHRDMVNTCKQVLSVAKTDPELNSLFFRDEFDLIINNAVLGDCGLILAHRLLREGAKLIAFDSTSLMSWYGDTYSFPTESSWIPDHKSTLDFPMNFWERFKNYLSFKVWYWRRQWEVMRPLEEMMKEVYQLESYTPLAEIDSSSSFVFVATHHGTDFPRSLPPFFINIGGMQCWQERKPFEGEFKEFLDNAKDGAILIAFGSTIDLSKIPEFFKSVFFDTMTKFPKVQFIWRWDGPLPDNHPKNLKVAKWLPQFDILGHPNLKGFISHAGLNSLTEATCQGVPVILLPLFADQDYNGYRVQAYEVGIRLEVRTLTHQIMEDAVREILTNNKYAVNMKRMSGIMKDRPMSPIDTAVYWTEFALRHESTSPLKPPIVPFWSLHTLDILLPLSFLTANLILVFFLCLFHWKKRSSKSAPPPTPAVTPKAGVGKGRSSRKYY